MRNNIGDARRSYALSVGGFTQEDAASFFGVSLGTYRNWEQCVGKLNGEILCAIADKYECSTDYLLCRTSDPAPYPPARCSAAENGEEERLVSAYRKCTKRGRMAVLNTAETMADCGLAKNTDDERPAKAIGA